MRLEVIRSKRLGLLVILLLLSLAFRVPTELYPESSLKWRSTSVYLPAAYARINERIWRTPSTLPPFLIQDIVLLPEDILLLIRLPGNIASHLPPKDKLTCLFNTQSSTSVTGLDYLRGRALVRCGMPGNLTLGNLTGDPSDIWESLSPSLFGGSQGVNICLLSGSKVIAEFCNGTWHIKMWSSLVFEIWVTSKDVVLFAKGINVRQGHNVSPDDLVCVFGDHDGQVVETKVTVSAQEVFRCAHPMPEHRRSLMGRPVTLKWEQEVLPTVAYYEEVSTSHPLEYAGTPTSATEICTCTMIYNVAKFLPEWGTFHSHVGVDRFILYDNNSEDELDEALTWLSDRQVQVSRYPWPWPKTQEAGFSHCAVAMRHACEWILFTDVDEFVFPAAYLPPSGRSTPLRELISTVEQRPRQPVRVVRLAPSVQRYAEPHQQKALPGQPSVSPVQEGEVSGGLVQRQERELQHMPTSLPRQRRLRKLQHIGLQLRLISEQRGPSGKVNAADHPPRDAPHKAPRGTSSQLGDEGTVGQISLRCRDFGPSNLTQHPREGVTQGYVCRSKREERHKSLVKLEAVSDDLQNAVHHFNMQAAYTTVTEDSGTAVVNHYKFQAWPEFRQKFRRRVSAYVADWKEARNLESRDRTPGLGFREEKPMDWETGFCDVPDTALRQYCRDLFAVNISGIPTFAWQI